VSCTAALAVMDVVVKDKLMENALDVGSYLLQQLNIVKSKHQIIGDVRGSGMFAGVELVKSRDTREPATEQAERVLYGMKKEHVIMSVDGPDCNVLKFKPPMCFSRENVDKLASALDKVLSALE